MDYSLSNKAIITGNYNFNFQDIQGSVNFNQNSPKSELKISDILKDFKIASGNLANYANKFKEKVHLLRQETVTLYNWIQQTSTGKDKLAVLTAKAGYGKSVVLKDLYDTLVAEEVPVLGLKADTLNVNSITEIQHELGLSDNPISMLKSLDATYTLVVVLIDQLDSLSQSLSSRRAEAMQTMLNLAEQAQALSHTKIIISSRIYDLQYDQRLQKLHQSKEFRLGELPLEEVKDTLMKLGFSVKRLSPKMLTFLCVPLHLELFTKLELSPPNDTLTLQSLYDEYWNKFLQDKAREKGLSVDNVIDLVQAIAYKMYEKQKITIKARPFRDAQPTVFQYLVHQGILTLIKKNEIQFAHQSFFDYAHARTLVQRGDKMSELLQGQHQGLFVRSKVQQVLSYLREFDEGMYKEELQKILFGDFRYHIKLMILNHIGLYEELIEEEKELIKKEVLENGFMRREFIESVNSPAWFQVMAEYEVLPWLDENEEIRHALLAACTKVMKQLPKLVVPYLKNLLEKETISHHDFSIVLHFIPDEKAPLGKPLYFRLKDPQQPINQQDYLMLMIKHEPDFVKNELLDRIKKFNDLQNNNVFSNQFIASEEERVYEAFYNEKPHEAFIFFVEAIKYLSWQTSYRLQEKQDVKFFSNHAFFSYTRNDGYNMHPHFLLMDFALRYLDEHTPTSKNEGMILALIKSAMLSELLLPAYFMLLQPKNQQENIYEFLVTPDILIEHHRHEYFSYALKTLLKEAFHVFTDGQKQEIMYSILNANTSFDTKEFFGYNQYELLLQLNDKEIDKFPHVKRRFQELQRKFGDINANPSPKNTSAIVGISALPKSAYENMSFDNWLSSFRKIQYSKENPFQAVSEGSHGSKFQEKVKTAPNDFFSLVKAIIYDDTIVNSYVVKGYLGLAEGKCSPEKMDELLDGIVERRETSMQEDELRMITHAINKQIERKELGRGSFAFLKRIALTYPDGEMRREDPVDSGINSVRGGAVHNLIRCGYNEAFREDILSTLDRIADNAGEATRASAILELGYFTHNYPDRTADIYLRLMHDLTPVLFRVPLHKLHPMVSLIHYRFDTLLPFFKRAIAVQDAHKSISIALFIGWLHDHPNTWEVLERLILESSIAQREITKFIFNQTLGTFRNKSITMLSLFLDKNDEELGEIYDNRFHSAPAINNKAWYHFIDKYIRSAIGKYHDYGIYKHLLKMADEIPEKCIQWALYLQEQLKEQKPYHLDQNHPIDLVIKAYNTIKDSSSSQESAEQAMDLFDKMLQEPRYRDWANRELIKHLDEY